MTLSNPKALYSRFLENHKDVLHFAAHSHHFWPDVTRDAQLKYWDDCSRLSDDKWRHIFSEVIPTAQKHIANILNLKHSAQIVFAPNTHELSTRILSLFLGKPQVKILTSTNEFHSWNRQIMRLKEIPQVTIDMVESGAFLTDRRKVIQAFKEMLKNNYDVLFLSQVFYDSGLALTDMELLEIKQSVPAQTLMVVDGYHGFAALPCDLSKLEGGIFYLGGGYKYAQAGEGVGFMVVPKGDFRPAFTGWFAEHNNLSNPSAYGVSYAPDAMAFMGATQDPSGLYRFNSVWDLFSATDMTTARIHQIVTKNQKKFLSYVPETFIKTWNLKPVFDPALNWHGHFLTYEAPTIEDSQSCLEELKKVGIIIDRRARRLRFGFGLYQDDADIISLCERLKNVAKKSQ